MDHRPTAQGLAVSGGEPNPLVALFRRCVVRIDDGDGNFRGTGFFGAPGQVVTCAHVVHGAAELRVRWRGPVMAGVTAMTGMTGTAEVAAAANVTGAAPPLESVDDPRTYPLPDLAVLDVGTEWDHPCVRLADGPLTLDGNPAGLYLAGYTVEHSSSPALTGVTAELESLATEGADTFYKLKRAQVLHGFSGSPLLDLHTQAVAAIAESTRGTGTALGGFAVPTEALATAFPALASASQEFHARDRRWRDAAEAERTLADERKGSRRRLPLRPPVVELTAGEEVSAATVLRPRHAVVGYVGREQILGDLANWCEQAGAGGEPAELELWFVTGAGGYGKTRLAVEACLEAEARGWTAGLLPPDAGDTQIQALADWPGRLLVAMDYAETSPALIGRLVEELAARSPRPVVRILLLVRRQASKADLITLFNERQEEYLGSLLRRASVSRLDDADSEVDRLELFGQGMADFGTLAGLPPGPMRPVRLRADHFARPLYVLTAAYLARMSPDADVDAMGETGLLRELLSGHEARYWASWDERRKLGLDPEDRRAAVAMAILLTAHGDDEALAVARLVPHYGHEPEPRLMEIARWLAQLYPPAANGGQLVLSPLEPDRLGEVLVGDVLREHTGLLAAACDAASDRQLAQALTVTGRIAVGNQPIRDQLRIVLDQRLGDYPGRGLTADGDELLAAVVSAMTISQPVHGAADAADRFPEVLPVWLRPLAAAITELAVDGLRTRAEDDPAVTVELSRMLSNLGVRLAEAGRRDEALTAAQEAVAIRRDLAQASPDAYLPDLAASLANLGNRLADAGRRDEALTTAQEAVGTYRQLAQASPAAYLPYLAASLSNLGIRLAETGHRDEALTAEQEALAIRRDLAQASPAAYLPDLARSLSNLGIRLAETGHRDEALTAEQEAVAIRRDLAQASPDAYLPDLAGSLSNLGNRLADAGRRDEALTTAQEAVGTYRQLAQASPAAYLPDLAASLSNLGIRLAETGHRDEALTAEQEALAIRRDLAQASPAAYLPDLARSLGNLGISLAETGHRDEALTTAQEAVGTYRQLAQASPAAYLPNLATVLSNLSIHLAESGRRDEALTTAQEALAIRRELAQASPAAYLPDLAGSLSNLGIRLAESGRRDEALTAEQEALAIRRDLAQASPAAYLPDLADSLSNLGIRLAESGRRDEALTAEQEALAIRRDLAQASPAAYLPDLARSLSNLGIRLAESGHRDEALTTAQEALAIRRDLAQASPAAYLPDLARSLSNLGVRLAEAGRTTEAEELLHEILGSFEHSSLGAGHILLVRGRWLLAQDRLGEAVTDLVAAADAFSQAHDRRMRGQVRQALRRLRLDDRAAFDIAWDQELGLLPSWLKYPDSDEELTGTVIAWVQTPDWRASRTYLNDHAVTLLTDRGEAALEDLIDVNPDSSDLLEHLALLQAARSRGPDAAYAADADQRMNDRLTRTLRDWINTRTWDQSQVYAAAHAGDLLDPTTLAILGRFAKQELRDHTIRVHRGLLGLANAGGFDAAYALLADPGQRRALLAGPGDDLPSDARLALARLHSGQSDDDPDAHFRLAVISLLAGRLDEAVAALADCADNAAPYERRDFARRLREATAGRSQLAGVTAELERILTGTPDSQPGEEDNLADLLLAWVGASTWEESEAFLTSHVQDLLTPRGYAMLGQSAAERPEDEALALHVSLLSAVFAQGIAEAYTQLRAELAQEQLADRLREWVGLAADPAASAAYLAEHTDDLHHPWAIGRLTDECDRIPGEEMLWRHLGLLLLGDQAADGYAAAETGDPSPFERATARLDGGDLDQALAWACLARAADAGPGALLMGQVHTRRDDPARARAALVTATEKIGSGRLGEVLDAYDTLIAAQPDDGWLRAEQADALERAGRLDDAVAAYDQALRLEPDDPSLHFNRASLLFARSRFEEAQAGLVTVTELRPDDILGAAVLLAAIAWPADAEQARQYFEAALASPGERLRPVTRAFYRAIALTGLGRAEDAVRQLQAVADQQATLDEAETMLINRFRDPPLPGLELILPFFAETET